MEWNLRVWTGCTTTLYGNRMAQNADNEAEFGTKDAMANEVTLSPNPNGGDFAIRVKTVQQSSEMVMFDAFGQKVFQAVLNEGNNKFNQSRLASGMYFIHIVVDGKVTVKRMEIMH